MINDKILDLAYDLYKEDMIKAYYIIYDQINTFKFFHLEHKYYVNKVLKQLRKEKLKRII